MALSLSQLVYMFNKSLVTPDSIGIVAVACVVLRISGHGAIRLPLFMRTPWNFSFGIPYQSWLYLFTLFLMTSDSSGTLDVAQMALIIFGHGALHLAIFNRTLWAPLKTFSSDLIVSA